MRNRYLLFALVSGFVLLLTETVHAKELFNIKGIKLGDPIETVKEAFPEIEIEPSENKAVCKDEDVVVENGSVFNAIKEDETQKFAFRLIYIDSVQTVVKMEYVYTAVSVSKEVFLERIHEKYDIDDITDENVLKIKNAMSDYKGITHFTGPEGHFFKLTDDDVLRLKYASSILDNEKPKELTHAVIFESSKFNEIDDRQSELGEEERKEKETECGKKELKDIGF